MLITLSPLIRGRGYGIQREENMQVKAAAAHQAGCILQEDL